MEEPSRILDFGFWILDFGFWILDFGFWIRIHGDDVFLTIDRILSRPLRLMMEELSSSY
jgi:hypothetical protein